MRACCDGAARDLETDCFARLGPQRFTPSVTLVE